MSDKLNWGYEEHDFSAIQATLMKYHPIENPHQYNKENIEEFKGFKEIEDIIHDNFLITKNYRNRWLHFRKFLENELKKPIQELMHIGYPCYSGALTLAEETEKNLTHTKELHFYISLLGPYYTILGFDKCRVRLPEITLKLNGEKEIRDIPFPANVAVTVSPYLEYEVPFLQLQKKILEYFPDMKFIPFNLNRIKIEGSTLLFRADEPLFRHTVFNALFQPENLFHTNIFEPKSIARGDIFYGLDEWLKIKKPDKNRLEEIRNDLLKNPLNGESITSLHKVWKLQTASRIPGVFKGMLGAPFLILDLTDKNIATIISKENTEPEFSKYSIVDNEIKIDLYNDSVAGFRVEQLGEMSLKLIVNVNLHNGERLIKGDVLEMIFEIYR